jgi:Ni,Fe-hydrogenase III small subunit/ferredoxin
MDWESATPVHKANRGIPVILPNSKSNCESCNACEDICPTRAIQKINDSRLLFDYGKCIQCGVCVHVCPQEKIINSGFTYVFALEREDLVTEYNQNRMIPKEAKEVSKDVSTFRKFTNGKGFTYREVAAAGNNTVESELNASFNAVFDSEHLGIRAVASPKHADLIVTSGPIGKNMEAPLAKAFKVMGEPKWIVACGTESVSGGLFSQGKVPKAPSLFIGGDPPRPDVILQAFRTFLGRFSFHFQEALHKYLESLK